MQILEPSIELEWITPEPLKAIERAGRVCYKSEDRIGADTAETFVRGIVKRGHEAVIEHASASFRIVTDRGISHEIVRHRVASYCQESTRYCNYGKEKFGNQIAVIRPPDLTAEQERAWQAAMEAAEKAYFALLSADVSPQIARSVLPTCLKTELIMTANFREWRHFLKLRLPPAAHPQVRRVAGMIHQVLLDECPAVFDDLG